MSALLDLLDEHGEAVEADLIDRGLRLRDWPSHDFTPRDLLVIVRHLPRTSALARAMEPEKSDWSVEIEMLSRVEHSLRVLTWMKTKDAQHKRNFPEPIESPWSPKAARARSFRGTRMSIEEASDFLGWDLPGIN